MKLLITGGAGFIGSNLIRYLLHETDAHILTLDRLSVPGLLYSLRDLENEKRHSFRKTDICDGQVVSAVLQEFRPLAVLHLAAESHVDRSIDDPEPFIRSNIVGTFKLLEAIRGYWRNLPSHEREQFRFVHVSTDEVHGSLGLDETPWTETAPHLPNSPYAASKAAADHLVRAWQRTYGLPTLTTNCSNNYGPYQFPEKLIPLMITKAVAGELLPVYGTGTQRRDWLYVEDHVRALHAVLMRGAVGEQYHIGGGYERSNLAIVHELCSLLDELLPDSPYRPHEHLITFVADRPGHDLRYAMDAAKISEELGWRPRQDFSSGLRKTVEWYLANPEWCRQVTAGVYQGQRLGLAQL